MAQVPPTRSWKSIYAVVRRIPRGRIATYGQVAELAGRPGQARQVGYALSALAPGSRVPWQRVVNVRGCCSLRREPNRELTQRMLLEEEGVAFGPGDRIDLEQHRWSPRGRCLR
jgi:methylated-DNA-protein-cysteine methyltransferase-like protein